MKKFLLLLPLVLMSLTATPAEGPQGLYVERNLIGSRLGEAQLVEIYQRLPQWRAQKREAVYAAFRSVPEEYKQELIAQGEALLDKPFVSLSASEFLHYKDKGGREGYEAANRALRNAVSTLAMAELMEGKGRFSRKLMDGIWALSEVTTWCQPAHLRGAAKAAGLPLPGEQIVDIFAGDTAAIMAWTLFLLEDELKKISVVVPDRIRYELNRRIIQPNLTVDFHRMGLDKTPGNNWNPWINKNWLTVLMLADYVDEPTFLKSMDRLIRSIDNYTNWYPADGGCDEGAGYWGASPSAYYTIVELLTETAPEAMSSMSREPLLHNMVSYIYKMEINGRFFVNFADCSPLLSPSAEVIYLWGDYLQDETLKRYAAYRMQFDNLEKRLGSASIKDYYHVVTALKGLEDITPGNPLPEYAAFPDLQIMTARDSEGETAGLFLAAQGGHNAESHNHNDAGNFVVAYDGSPLIIDAGAEAYNSKTFSSQRYTIWTTQSAWHNTPTVNGTMQGAGIDYAAQDVHISNHARGSVFSLDISKAYPPEAGVRSWQRTITLNRGRNVTVEDDYSLTKSEKPHEQNLLTHLKPSVEKAGEIRLSGEFRGKVSNGVIRYDARKFKVEIDERELTDRRLRQTWGERIYRIRLVSSDPALKGKDKIIISYK